MPADISRWMLALAAATLIAGAARARRSLSRDGMLAAIVLGTILVGTAGWWAGLLLIAFFLSSTLLSRVNTRSSISQARGSERDAVQVFANGGLALATAIGSVITESPTLMVAMAGAIAGANADTWSTEIGQTSRSRPRLITTGKAVAPGTSGAVSRRGLAGALTGGALIGILAGIGLGSGWLPDTDTPVTGVTAVTLGGFAGSLVDSLLGATVQDQRVCDHCQKQTESRVHSCGTPTRHLRGIPWLDNDVVNLLCTASGAALATVLILVL